jgi:hypothetical protein
VIDHERSLSFIFRGDSLEGDFEQAFVSLAVISSPGERVACLSDHSRSEILLHLKEVVPEVVTVLFQQVSRCLSVLLRRGECMHDLSSKHELSLLLCLGAIVEDANKVTGHDFETDNFLWIEVLNVEVLQMSDILLHI